MSPGDQFVVSPDMPLDRNAKARIMVYVRAYNARMREEGQHTGPITRAFMDVLRALLYGFHNGRTGAASRATSGLPPLRTAAGRRFMKRSGRLKRPEC
jgi:hypothetical protein